jgi:hypothetical protein
MNLNEGAIMPTINNNRMTPTMRKVWRDGKIKGQIKPFFAEAVLAANGAKSFPLPPHHPNMRVAEVSNWIVEEDEDDEDKLSPLKQELAENPSIAVNFTYLHKSLPEVFNAQSLNEFADHLVENGFVPDDVTVALSPYNDTAVSADGALNLVFIFDVANYGTSETNTVDARFTLLTSEDDADDVYLAGGETVNAVGIPAPPTPVKRNPFDLLQG